ncbi:GGDEF domain-containing protein [Montanilutibacter psychrotolerans]|uniref:diguanylate cyclase n=1 Tax=Montanilutibacter psychrotolerans TaxID=1327343 RepID=A0A3M8SYT3_9GAMM|nr:GGDEF domain-containing protein [Lysobacter psychrotolerans]RNF84414.1 sensor domain-containing diguanylate cyclase [Lysobacter psychrotolerans]
MSPTPPPSDVGETRRQAALDAHALLDTLPERAFDDVAMLAALLTGAPAAGLALIDQQRLWFKARTGLRQQELTGAGGLIAHAQAAPRELLQIGQLVAGEHLDTLPLLVDGRALPCCIGVPLLADRQMLGLLLVFDTAPHTLSARQNDGLHRLVRQARQLLALRRCVLEQRNLLAEREAFGQRLEDARADMQRRHDQLAHEATHDPLTGLLNRAALDHLRSDPVSQEHFNAQPYALILLDIDHFKQVNDRHGHRLGDLALQAVAEAVNAAVRSSDLVVRYGGEELLVVLPHTRLDGAAEVAERIRRRVARVSSLPFALTVSLGVAAGDPARDQPEHVFERADQALYRAKTSGRDRVVVDDSPLFDG